MTPMTYPCFPLTVALGVQTNFGRVAAIHGSHIDWKMRVHFQSGKIQRIVNILEKFGDLYSKYWKSKPVFCATIKMTNLFLQCNRVA